MTPPVNLACPELADDRESLAVQEIIYTLDQDGNFTFVNSAGQRLLGYSREELARMKATDIVSTESAEYVCRLITGAEGQQVGTVFEIDIITRNHRRVTLETSIDVVIRDGRAIEIRGIALPPVGIVWEAPSRCVDQNFRNELILSR